MAVEIIRGDRCAALRCNTTNRAFGPVFATADEAEEFLEFLHSDPRSLDDTGDMHRIHQKWRKTWWEPEVAP